MLKSYKQGICIDCAEQGDKGIKPIISGRCFNAPFHYQKYQQAKYREKQKDKPVKQAKIKPVSDKRSKDIREYSKLRKKFLDANPMCQSGLVQFPHAATDIHHMAGRCGDLFLNTKYWLAVCRTCHQWIETHPEEAKKKRLSVSRLSHV